MRRCLVFVALAIALFSPVHMVSAADDSAHTARLLAIAGGRGESSKTTHEGILRVLHRDQFEEGKSRLQYVLTTRTRSYSLHFADGRNLRLKSGTQIRVRGHAIADAMVVKTAANVEVMAGPEVTAPPTNHRILGILIDAADSEPFPFSAAEAEEKLFRGPFSRFHGESSHGKLSVNGKVIGPYRLNRNGIVDSVFGATCVLPNIDGYSYRDEVYHLIKDDVDITKYERVIIFFNHPCFTGGLGSIGEFTTLLALTPSFLEHKFSVSWIGSIATYNQEWGYHPFAWDKFAMFSSHEFGHNLGLYHSDSWDCDPGEVLYGTCHHIEYGDTRRVMGRGLFGLEHTGWDKKKLGWYDNDSGYLKIEKPGRYILGLFENNSGPRVACVRSPQYPTTDPSFCLEYPGGVGFNSALRHPAVADDLGGLVIYWIADKAPFSRLLDMSPTSADASYFTTDWLSNTLKPGGHFDDPGRGISVAVVSTDETSIMFDVDFVEPVCARTSVSTSAIYAPPDRVEVLPRMDGQELFYWLVAFNEDSAVCGAEDFELRVKAPEGSSFHFFDPTSSRFSAGEGMAVGFTLYLPPLEIGTHAIELEIINNSGGGITTTITKTLVSVALPAPKNLAFQESNSIVTLSWNSAPGTPANAQYAVRAVDDTDPALRLPGNDCLGDPHYLCVTVASSSMAMLVQTGHRYTWWVHAISGEVWSEPATASFKISPAWVTHRK